MLPPVSYEEALHRVQAYCTHPMSGWATYDLCGIEARRAKLFDTVTPWSLLWTGALAGQVRVGDISNFTIARRQQLARHIAAVPEDQDLNGLDDAGRAAVVSVCQFGFPGVWAPKSTKLAALYRPRAIPVLDGFVAMAFGFARAGFSEGTAARSRRIERVVTALAAALDQYADVLADLRRDALRLVPHLSLIPDLRLLDIIIWTSQDDRTTRVRKKPGRWLGSNLEDRVPIALWDVAPVATRTGSVIRNDLEPGFPYFPPAPPEQVEPWDTPVMIWIELDLRTLATYDLWNDSPWHNEVPWADVMNALRPLVMIGDVVDMTILDRLPPDLPELVREGVASLFAEPLGIQDNGQPVGGGHRMTAMQKQGLRYAFGMA